MCSKEESDQLHKCDPDSVDMFLPVTDVDRSIPKDVYWSEAETMKLISLYETHKEDFTHAKKRKHVWAVMQEEMAAHNYFRDSDKLERKWINLLRVYRSIKDNRGPRTTGRGAQNYKFFNKIEEIMGDELSASMRSSTVLDVGIEEEDLDVMPDVDDESLESCNSTTTDDSNLKMSTKRRKLNQSIILRKQKLKQKAKRHKEMMELEIKKMKLEQKKISLLEKILEKLT